MASVHYTVFLLHAYLISDSYVSISDFIYVLLFDTCQRGEAPLYKASLRDHDKVVEVLIAAGADVNLANKMSY